MLSMNVSYVRYTEYIWQHSALREMMSVSYKEKCTEMPNLFIVVQSLQENIMTYLDLYLIKGCLAYCK